MRRFIFAQVFFINCELKKKQLKTKEFNIIMKNLKDYNNEKTKIKFLNNRLTNIISKVCIQGWLN